MMGKVIVLNGPNLNMLGQREPDKYGVVSLDSINKTLAKVAQDAECEFNTFQSNSENDLIESIHRASSHGVDFIIINPAAFTHTSVALRDAILSVQIPFIEVHLSNIHRREDFRKHSYFSDIAVGVISGLGAKGYKLALLAAIDILNKK